MAEKEERILVTKCSGHCRAQRISVDPFDEEDGLFCDKSGKWLRITEKECAKCKDPVLLGISRQEAIDTMCEGWNKLREQINADKEHAHCCSNKMIMEAALNALLSKVE